MSFLIVHLSDIHIDAESNLVFKKIEAIAQAIIDNHSGATDCILLLSGDITYSGEKTQFTLASKMLSGLRELLERKCTWRTHVITIPGNHDCCFSKEQSARNTLIDDLDSRLPPAESTEKAILEPLRNYFSFATEIGGSDKVLTHTQPYFTTIHKSIEDSQVAFHLFNSAWMSRIGEKPGTLKFPESHISDNSDDASNYSISIIHHPFNWFQQPDFMRQIREKIESLSDVVFLGHEHVEREVSVESPGISRVKYFEGAALQVTGADHHSEFSIVVFDIDASKYESCIYSWDRQHSSYRNVKTSNGPLPRNSQKSINNFRFTDKFDNFLENTDLPIAHGNVEHVKLSDIFSFPDLREVDDNEPDGKWNRLDGDSFVEESIKQNRTLVTGMGKIGKTSCAKTLARLMHIRGYLPVLIDAHEFINRHSFDRVRNAFRKSIENQYATLTPDQYAQNTNEKKVLIVDDFHVLLRHAKALQHFYSYVHTAFDNIVLFADTEKCVDDYISAGPDDTELLAYRRLDICELGYKRLRLMTRKWLALGANGTIDDDTVQKISDNVSKILSRNAIPHQPWIIIVMLQQTDANRDIAAKNGSYGHLFQAIVTFALSRFSDTKIDINTMLNYLAEIAYYMYSSNLTALSSTEYVCRHQAYCSKYDIPLDHTTMLKDLCEANLLREDDGEIAFRTKFSYCFFVAWYLSLNIHDENMKREVISLAKRLYHQESANILLFLAHLSNDPIIVQSLLDVAGSLFSEIQPLEFDVDVQHINNLNPEHIKIVGHSGSLEEARDQMIAQADDQLANRDLKDTDGRYIQPAIQEMDEIQEYHLIDTSMQTIEILGQVLKNNVGTIDGSTKRMIVVTVFQLARRLLAECVNEYDPTDEDLLRFAEHVADKIKEENRNISREKMERQVANKLFYQIWFATYCVAKKVSQAVGHELLSPTFQHVVTEDPCFANRIFDLGIELERQGNLPVDKSVRLYDDAKKNRLVESLVRALVLDHLYLYRVKHTLKQKISNKLNMKIPLAVYEEERKKNK